MFLCICCCCVFPRSVVVAGGTMQPISEFQDQLFISAGVKKERVQHFSCGHVVPAEQLLPVALPRGPTGLTFDFTHQHRTDPKMLDELGRVLVNVCAVVPGGVVCFLTSYDYEHKVRAHFTASGVLARLSARKKVFWEPKKANQLDAVLSDYTKTIRMTAANTGGVSGSLLLSVVGEWRAGGREGGGQAGGMRSRAGSLSRAHLC
ncbi:ATP-dependent DNA helicase DDX11 [Chionoecetes opilio]|uniref:ATP-dependent DNA helicase DDX11 n=1 Tax=Chionoecetes opilio TaxID=41210 RepID=A0A8J4XYQ8_CHIOP|nr:ATP-dependent DNA helicase DDX11 [Chionoecetes opilio]